MASSPTISPASARSQLVQWANAQDGWVRHLVSQVILTGRACSPEQIEEIYDVFLREKGLKPGQQVAIDKLRDDAASQDSAEVLTLLAIEDLSGVNALASSQSLSFNAKLTVIFGENAAGKTGYVRVLKRAAAVRTAETILPDLNAATISVTQPSANISFLLGNQKQKLAWRNESGYAPLNRIDVFDSRASALHVDGDLTYVYTPGELVRFPFVQQGLDQVRSTLDREIKTATTTSNPFVSRFDRKCRFYASIESLGAATDLGEIRKLAVASDEEQIQTTSLRAEIDALRSNTPQAQLKLLQAQRQHITSIRQVVEIVRDFDSAEHNDAALALAGAQRAYEEATSLSFAGSAIPGILQSEWQRFVQAGDDYVRTLQLDEAYPTEQNVCLYCQQPLTAQAITLLKKYRDFCNGQFRMAVTAAERRVSSSDAAIFGIQIDQLRSHAEELASTAVGEPILLALSEFITKVEALKQECSGSTNISWKDRHAEASTFAATVAMAEQQTTTLIEQLQARSEVRQKTLREREDSLLDIESRLLLRTILPDVETFVSKAKWVNQAQIQSRRFPTILRSLTETSKAVSEQVLNRDFERLFSDECKTLRAPKVQLLFPGNRGQVSRKKSLAQDRRLGEVLSEGEQKVIALADFLAELSLKPAAPVVFDDPITSLDYRRMSDVIKRIVALADTRQVIIFTHNIWFTTELLAAFEKHPQDCTYHDVARDGNRVGVITKGSHPRSDTYKVLRGKINELLQTAEKLSGEAQAAMIEKAYEYLRNICEVIVETELFQGVTQRYQPNVRMTSLPNIRYDRLKAAADVIYPIYEDCCRYIGSHSQPLETLNVRPDLAQIKSDWAGIEGARSAYMK